MKKTKLLIIDDDPLLCDTVVQLLSSGGYHVFSANSGKEGLHKVFQQRPELILLDILMPGMDGFEVLKRIRELADIPIIMLSGVNKTSVIIRALDLGADDFIEKPFENGEFLARVRSLLRRASPSNTIETLNYADGYLSIVIQERRVYVEGQSVRLTVTEYKFLEYLYLNKGRVCTYEGILENIWGGTVLKGHHYVHVYIQKLRKKLEEDPYNPKYILTEHGVGYRFEIQIK
jgi:two-component system, OmpR family, KDP operon response regulator KdpE